MISLNSIDSCRKFLNTKKTQGFISDKTWLRIKDQWINSSSDEEKINLTKAVYKAIAITNHVYPISYFS